MIGMLSGVVTEIQAERMVMDVGGVGYEVYCHGRTLASLPAVGTTIRMYTDLQFRNELLRLYGFSDARERDWFQLLCSVHHVGARGALSILGTVGVEELADAVTIGDAKTVQRAPGIGRRIAERVIMELKGKVPAPSAPRPRSSSAGIQADAVTALAGLGYATDDALAVVRATMGEVPGEPLEVVIRESLRRIGRQHAG